MKHLTHRIARFMSAERPAAVAEIPSRIGMRDDARWDEALLAAICDENARVLVDHWGPRCR